MRSGVESDSYRDRRHSVARAERRNLPSRDPPGLTADRYAHLPRAGGRLQTNAAPTRRRRPSGPYARSEYGEHRGNRRPVRTVSHGQGESRLRIRDLAEQFSDQLRAPPKRPGARTPRPRTSRHGSRPSRCSPQSGSASSTPTPSTNKWRTFQRYIGRRECYDDTDLTIVGLVSDRTAMRSSPNSRTARLYMATSVVHRAISGGSRP